MVAQFKDLAGVTAVLVFASFYEAENLSDLLKAIGPSLLKSDLVIIADDSGLEYRETLQIACFEAMRTSSAAVIFNYADSKSGRGSAIRRAFQVAGGISLNITHFVEADSDGSHRPDDIIRILRSNSSADLLIGSRYSEGSKISGWPLTRRIFSRTLNLLIPRILSVKSKDLTNGLRRYSRDAVNLLLNARPQNAGFIYLSESAYILAREKMHIEDIPIHFENRVHGESTVGSLEIINSLRGIVKLILTRAKDVTGF